MYDFLYGRGVGGLGKAPFVVNTEAICRHELLGGLINDYYREISPANEFLYSTG